MGKAEGAGLGGVVGGWVGEREGNEVGEAEGSWVGSCEGHEVLCDGGKGTEKGERGEGRG